jgi:hypothetical protein
MLVIQPHLIIIKMMYFRQGHIKLLWQFLSERKRGIIKTYQAYITIKIFMQKRKQIHWSSPN